jgi:DNA-binding Xre family transcriptional regulator
MQKERGMAVDHRFIVFCSSLLNSKTAQRQFNNPLKQKELIAKHGLTRAQVKAVQSRDVEAITLELKKEILKAVKKDPSIVAIGW